MKTVGALGCSFVCITLALLPAVLIIASLWRVFEKAGQPGWAALVPFYNTYVLTVEVARKDIVWFILLFVPFVNLVAVIVVYLEISRKFGYDVGFAIGLLFLPFIFFPILAYGDARYRRRRIRELYEDDDEFGDRYNSYDDDEVEEIEDFGPRRRQQRPHDVNEVENDEDEDDRPRRKR